MERLRVTEALLGLFAIVLLASLGMPWASLNDVDATAVELFSVVDLFLLATGLLALATVAVTALKDTPALPIAMDVLTTWLAGITTLMVLFRVIDLPGPDGTSRSFGLLVGVVCLLGVLVSAFYCMRVQDAPGLRPNPAPELMPEPPAGA